MVDRIFMVAGTFLQNVGKINPFYRLLSAKLGTLASQSSVFLFMSLQKLNPTFPIRPANSFFKGVWLICFVLSFFIAEAQLVDSPVTGQFDSALARFDTLPALKSATWGFCAVDLATGEVWKHAHSNLSLIPASTLKPLTTATALSVLGSEYRFKTQVQISGSIDSAGILNGNVVLMGGGDPTPGSDRFGESVSLDSVFAMVLKALQSKGIRTVSGRIVADASVFGSQPVIPSWQYEDLGNAYGAPPAGISLYENSLTFVITPGRKPGEPAPVGAIIPEAPYLGIINQVTTGPRGSGEQVEVGGTPWSNSRILTGTVPAGVKSIAVRGAMPDPPFQAAFMLHNFLVTHGISIQLPPTTDRLMQWSGEHDTLPRTLLMEYQSPPLKDIVYQINMRSVNLFAEALACAVGRTVNGEGTTTAGLRVAESFLMERKINTEGLRLRDGSGLSRKNLVTAEALALMLASCTRESWYPEYYASFPVAGESGSVASMFRKSKAKGNLRAKSGTLEGVRGYCGYATNAGERKLAYVLIINNYTCSQSEITKEMEWLLSILCSSDE